MGVSVCTIPLSKGPRHLSVLVYIADIRLSTSRGFAHMCIIMLSFNVVMIVAYTSFSANNILFCFVSVVSYISQWTSDRDTVCPVCEETVSCCCLQYCLSESHISRACFWRQKSGGYIWPLLKLPYVRYSAKSLMIMSFTPTNVAVALSDKLIV